MDGRRQASHLPSRFGLLFLVMATGLAVWTVWLTHQLPSHQLADHWNVAWAGFDVMLAAALAATGIAVIRRSPWLYGSAVCAATLLIVDAWFDVLTANGHRQLIGAFAEAAFIEIPLAAACVYLAVREKRALANPDDDA